MRFDDARVGTCARLKTPAESNDTDTKTWRRSITDHLFAIGKPNVFPTTFDHRNGTPLQSCAIRTRRAQQRKNEVEASGNGGQRLDDQPCPVHHTGTHRTCSRAVQAVKYSRHR